MNSLELTDVKGQLFNNFLSTGDNIPSSCKIQYTIQYKHNASVLSKLNSCGENIWIAGLIFLISNFPKMLSRSCFANVLVNLNFRSYYPFLSLLVS